jgi:Leucine-rich repeat (LRR) protein
VGLVNLRQLNLVDNRINITADKAFAGVQLESLSLSRNTLTSPPNLTPSAATLLDLNMDHNHISSFPNDYFSNFTNLRILNLGHNLLSTVPELSGLRLSDLHLQNNVIVLRPDDFENVSVRSLYLGYNSIENVVPISNLIHVASSQACDIGFYDNNCALLELVLAGNNLSSISAEDFTVLFTSIPSLRVLSLENTGIADIPTSALGSGVRYLYLSGNMLTRHFVSELNSLDLSVLDLTDNRVDLKMGDFTNSSIRALYLRNNSITSILPITELGSSLETLSLDDNDLSEVSPEHITALFQALPELEDLNVRNCQLSSFPDIGFMRELIIDARGNRFHCDCRM